MEAARDGMVDGIWLTDLLGDASPELVVAVSSAGSGTYGTIHIYERGESGLERVSLPDLTESQRAGYMGHDVFAVEAGSLWRSFPVYVDGDANADPTGGVARFRYSFADSSWLAVSDSAGS